MVVGLVPYTVSVVVVAVHRVPQLNTESQRSRKPKLSTVNCAHQMNDGWVTVACWALHPEISLESDYVQTVPQSFR